jgi:transposase-like protein/IS1 family transposase
MRQEVSLLKQPNQLRPILHSSSHVKSSGANELLPRGLKALERNPDWQKRKRARRIASRFDVSGDVAAHDMDHLSHYTMCAACGTGCQRFGKQRNGLRRFRCRTCGKTFTESHARLFDAMTVPEDKELLALQLLLEGNSLRSTERIVGIDRNTIMKLLVLAGERCAKLLTERVQNVRVEHLELDEVWAYVGCHQRFVDHEREDAHLRGDQYTFIALEERTKMVMAWHLGKRNLANTHELIAKVRHATAADQLFDVSTDAFAPYEVAIDGGLFERANHAQIVKLFSRHIEEGRERYSPARFVSVAKDAVTGMPDLDRASTSHVERKTGRCVSGVSGSHG